MIPEKLHLIFFFNLLTSNDKATEPKWDKVSWRKNKNGHLWGFLWGHKPAWMAISAKVTLFYSIFPCSKGFVFSSGQCSLSFFLEYQHQSKCHFSGDIFSFILLRIFLPPQGVIQLHDLDSCNHPESVGWSLLHICQYHWLHKLRYSIQTGKMVHH